MFVRGGQRGGTGSRGTPAVLFVDDGYWDCFAQFAVGLRGAGIRAVRVTTRPPLPMSKQFIFDRTIQLRSPTDFDDLASALEGEILLDVQTVERLAIPTVTNLGPFRTWPEAVRWDRKADVVDKPTAACRMEIAGLMVPDLVTDPTATPDEVIRTLGLPVVHKLRTGSSGDGVTVLRSKEELEAIMAATDDPSKYFFERFVDGRHIQFAGIVNAGAHDQTVTYQTLRRFSSMGPASEIRVLNDEQLRRTGLRVADALGLSGMVNINVIRDESGRDWVHDVNPRIWGSAVSFRLVGVDFLNAYISWLSKGRGVRAQSAPTDGAEFEVFPVAYATPRPGESTVQLYNRFARAARPFAGYVSTSYVLYESMRQVAMGTADAVVPSRRARR
jgi:hypothetical protein